MSEQQMVAFIAAFIAGGIAGITFSSWWDYTRWIRPLLEKNSDLERMRDDILIQRGRLMDREEKCDERERNLNIHL